MNKIRFTHKIMVPNYKSKVDAAAGYTEEMEDVKVFTLIAPPEATNNGTHDRTEEKAHPDCD